MNETKRLTNADLAEIKKRAEALGESRLAGRSALLAQNQIITEDVPALLAEVERLNKKLDSLAKDASEETIENIRYRLALEKIVNGDADSLGDAYRIAREALGDVK